MPRDLHPGFSGCAPAIFVALEPDTTVRMSAITYADVTIAGKTYPEGGMLKAFREEISHSGRAPTTFTVSVDLGKWTGNCSSLEYSVEVAGRTYTSPKLDAFNDATVPRSVAFAPEEPVSIILGGGLLQGDMTTEFGYDDKGRRYVRRQAFAADGVAYEVLYSDYVYKGPPTGKMASFTAHIRAIGKQ
jgi:hypothetical protein